MVPYAFNDSADTILVNSPSWWAVYDGPNQEAAKAFLQWCSETKGQEILVLEAGCISPFASCTIAANDPLAETVMDHMARGKTSSWGWLKLPEGLSMNYTGQLFADFAGGTLDAAGFVKAMISVVDGAV
jgi:raffinose/stachyose/melibiose transport system substrate-binding protein